MGKNIIAVVFVVISGIALFVFKSRDDRTLKDQVTIKEKQPRIILEDFTLYRYNKHTVQSTLTGRIAHFMDPNILEVYGDIRGLRHNSSRREHFSAQSAAAYFYSTGVVQLMQNSKIQRCEVENNVRVGSGDNVILTQYAQYIGDSNVLRSDLPVQFNAPRSKFYGKGGFHYQVDTEELNLHGPIKGTLQSEAIPNL